MAESEANGIAPDAPVEVLPGIRKPQIRALAKLGVHTVADLLSHVPRRYEDRSRFDPVPEAPTDGPVCLHVRVLGAATRRWGRGRMVVEATVADAGRADGPTVVCRWFNAHHARRSAVPDATLVVYGTVTAKGRRLLVEHPEFELAGGADEEAALLHTGRIVPVHPGAAGLTPRALRALVHRALGAVDSGALRTGLPASLESLSAPAYFRALHFPASLDEAALARRQAVLAELFRHQLVLAWRARRLAEEPGHAKAGGRAMVGRLLRSLPFGLTAAQRAALDVILDDLAADRPMNRLLQGDVGCGKTVVAALAMAMAVGDGWQCALMAPTRVLAEQHHRTLGGLLAPVGVSVQLCVGGRGGSAGDPGPADLADGGAGVIVGTHALLHDAFPFRRLGLIVIDEQQKFGVLQRARLRRLGDSPDVLVMTATPIPRTLALTLYGDLPVTVIGERPPGRGRVVTRVRDRSALPRVIAFLRREIAGGGQIFIVHGLIGESGSGDRKTAAGEIGAWRERLAPAPVGLVHGRLPPEERAETMGRFAAGDLPVLVATTVIEVGVDVPRASVMVIEDAHRLGLSQLHQLRGRVGRGSGRPAYCILLVPEDADPGARGRLALLERSDDGFVIAEEDFRRRGPGDMLGFEQSGLPPLRVACLAGDHDLLLRARASAATVLDGDPALSARENEHLRALIVNYTDPGGGMD